MQELYLYNNDMGREEIEHLVGLFLPLNPNLQKLGIGVSIKEEGNILRLERVIARLQSLSYLGVSFQGEAFQPSPEEERKAFEEIQGLKRRYPHITIERYDFRENVTSIVPAVIRTRENREGDLLSDQGA